jgi:hypothetical protein
MPVRASDVMFCLVLLASLPSAGAAAPGPQPGPAPEPAQVLQYAANDLYGRIDGGAELFMEFGFERLTVERFALAGGEVELETYRMASPLAALGIYLAKCGREEPMAGVPDRNTGNRYQITLVRGRDFVQANNFSGEPDRLPFLIELLARRYGDLPPDPRPELFSSLPREGLIEGSELLVRGPFGLQPIITLGEGDVLRLGGELFAVVADYRLPSSEESHQTRVYVHYPDEQTAAAVLAGLIANLDPYLKITAQDPEGFKFQDWRQCPGEVRRDGRLLMVRVPVAPAG